MTLAAGDDAAVVDLQPTTSNGDVAAQMRELQALLDMPVKEQNLLDMIDQDMREGPAALQQMRAIGQMPQQLLGKVKELPGMEGLSKVGTKVGQAGVDGLLSGVEVMGKGVEAVGKGVGLVANKTFEAASTSAAVVGKGVGIVADKVGEVAEKVLPQFALDAAAVTKEIAMERLEALGATMQDILKDPAWQQFQKDAKNSGKKGYKFWNYYRVQLFYVLATTTFLGGVILMADPAPPDNIVDAVFMTVSAMSGAGLTTIPMSAMTAFGLRVTYFIMLAGGICFLLLPPVLWRIYQYRRFKPMVQKVLRLRESLRTDEERARAGAEDKEEKDILEDFELQDQGLRVLAIVLVLYNFFFLFVCSVLLHLLNFGVYGPIAAITERKINHFWFSTFAAVSSFNNVGFSLLDDNYTQLADRPLALFLMTFLIIAGNSGLPIFLRMIFAVLHYLRPNSAGIKFVLDNPRRVTTAFYDSRQTAALFLIVVMNLMVQYIFFLATCLRLSEVNTVAPYNQLLWMGWFQSVSTRAAGMNVFDLRSLSKATAVIYALMMYIGSAPMISMMQASEQRVAARLVDGEILMVYEDEDEKKDAGKQFKAYLSSHIRWLCVAFLLIATAEQRVLSTMDPVNLFDIMFEILSGYGTSGLSMGAPNMPFSLCGTFTEFSKVVLIVVKLMGKHRGLPSSSDAALDGQYHRIHSMLLHLEAQARFKLGQGERPEAPDWAKEELASSTKKRKGGGTETHVQAGLLANMELANSDFGTGVFSAPVDEELLRRRRDAIRRKKAGQPPLKGDEDLY